jgi:hypothetical protein
MDAHMITHFSPYLECGVNHWGSEITVEIIIWGNIADPEERVICIKDVSASMWSLQEVHLSFNSPHFYLCQDIFRPSLGPRHRYGWWHIHLGLSGGEE